MGYIDLIETENKQPVTVGNVIIEAKDYQSKDFMFEENNTFWQGDWYIITRDGIIEFGNKEKTTLKPSGLVNIYSIEQNETIDYYLLLDNGKILQAWKDTFFDDLPQEIQEKYFLEWK